MFSQNQVCLGLQNVILSGNGVSADVIKARMEMRIRMGSKSNHRVLVRDLKGHTETQRRRCCEDGVWDCSDAATSPVCPEKAQMGGGKEGFSLRDSTECGSASKLISNFWLPERGENKFLLFWGSTFVVICYGSPK